MHILYPSSLSDSDHGTTVSWIFLVGGWVPQPCSDIEEFKTHFVCLLNSNIASTILILYNSFSNKKWIYNNGHSMAK